MRTPANICTQRGAVAIEFAAVFVLFFAIFYAIVSYALPLVLLQNLNAAAAEGARAAVGVERYPADSYPARLQAHAQTAALSRLQWLPASVLEQVTVTPVVDTEQGLFSLTVEHAYGEHPLFPVLHLPPGIEVPKLPERLRASAGIAL